MNLRISFRCTQNIIRQRKHAAEQILWQFFYQNFTVVNGKLTEFERTLACNPENRSIRNVLRDSLSSHLSDVPKGMMGNSRCCFRNSETGRLYGQESVTAWSSSATRKAKVYGTIE